MVQELFTVALFEENNRTVLELLMKKAKEMEELEADEESWEEETKDQKKINQWMIDDAVEELTKIELNQRKKKEYDKGFKPLPDNW